MTPEQAQLVDRIHRALAGEADARVVAMFGGRAFMVDDRLLVSAQASGDLLVRVPPERFEELVARPGVSPATMGKGRRMGRGWVTVAADAIATDAALGSWIDTARG